MLRQNRALACANAREKLSDESGVTIVVALFLLLIVGVISAVILVGANSSLRAVFDDYEETANQLVIDSALRDVRDDLVDTEVVRTGRTAATYSYAPIGTNPTGLQYLVADALAEVQADGGTYTEQSPYARNMTIEVNNNNFGKVDAVFKMYPQRPDSASATAHDSYAIRIEFTYKVDGVTYTEYLAAECEVEEGTQTGTGEVHYRWGTPSASKREA